MAINVSNWENWEMVCENYGFDPYKTIEFSIDKGGGNSMDFEYFGDPPEEGE